MGKESRRPTYRVRPPPSVHRYLGRIEAFDKNYWLYDRVEYDNLTQQVTYRLRQIEPDNEILGMIETHVTYYTFDHLLVTEMLLSAGFHRSCVETCSIPPWPYLVIVARKTDELELALVEPPL